MITTIQSKFYTRLKNLVAIYLQKVDDKVQEQLSKLSVLDKAPTDNLPLKEKVIEGYIKGEYEGQDSVIVSGRIGEFMTDPEYNRGDALRYGNQERDLNQMGGFSYMVTWYLYCRYTLCPSSHRITSYPTRSE